MRFYTAHLRQDREPILLREGFSWGALVFGPLWLLAHGAWVSAILVGVVDVAILVLAHGALAVALTAWAAWLTGLWGWDLLRWHFAHRRYGELHVIAARDEPAAMARLLAARPDQIGRGL